MNVNRLNRKVADRLSTQLSGDLGQEDDGGKGKERLPVLVHVIHMGHEVESASAIASRIERASLGVDIGSGELGSFRFEGWHSERHVHAISARGACGRRPGRSPLVVRGSRGAAGTDRGLDINATVRADTDNSTAELSDIAQHEHCCQQVSHYGHRVSRSHLH